MVQRDSQATLEERLDRLEGRVKESETSVFRALKTLVQDLEAYRKGERPSVPTAAMLGLIFAYLRPRLIVTVAGLGALLFTAAQVYLVYQQNFLISAQTALLEAQSESNKVAALSTILAGMQSEDARSHELSTAMLSVFQEQSFDVLLLLASNHANETSNLAVRALATGKESHTLSQSTEFFEAMKRSLYGLSGAADDLVVVSVGAPSIQRAEMGVNPDAEKQRIYAKADELIQAITPYVDFVSHRIVSAYKTKSPDIESLVRAMSQYIDQVYETNEYFLATQDREPGNRFAFEFNWQANNFEVRVCPIWYEVAQDVSENLCRSFTSPDD